MQLSEKAVRIPQRYLDLTAEEQKTRQVGSFISIRTPKNLFSHCYIPSRNHYVHASS
jgi:hypothetical protein